MEKYTKIQGWHIHHQEKLLFHTNKGTPIIRLKFFQYPAYRQTVIIDKLPTRCKIKIKGNNSFFVFQHRVGTKGIISLDRIITVIPTTSYVSPVENWGTISDFSKVLQLKYQQSSKYWPLKSEPISDISKEGWFRIEDLSSWVQSTGRFIKDILKHREKQEKRLGAVQALVKGIGDCDEFTDLFITLARIRGIPCRRLTGLFITQKGSSSEAHAWGEILSPLKGWIPIDIALNNFGNHSINYVILKIEEFNPALPDYQIQTRNSSNVHYQWEFPEPVITPKS